MAFKGTASDRRAAAPAWSWPPECKTELGDIARMTSESQRRGDAARKAAGPAGAQSGDGHVDRGGGSRPPLGWLGGKDLVAMARDGGWALCGWPAVPEGSADRGLRSRWRAACGVWPPAQRAGSNGWPAVETLGSTSVDLRRQDPGTTKDAEPENARGAAGRPHGQGGGRGSCRTRTSVPKSPRPRACRLL